MCKLSFLCKSAAWSNQSKVSKKSSLWCKRMRRCRASAEQQTKQNQIQWKEQGTGLHPNPAQFQSCFVETVQSYRLTNIDSAAAGTRDDNLMTQI